MNLDWSSYPLTLRQPLRISRSVMARRDAVHVRLSHGEVTGHGEVVTSVYFGLDLARIGSLLDDVRKWITNYPDAATLQADLPALAGRLADAPGVLAAIDAAAHDLAAKRDGVPVHQLVDQARFTPVATAYTIDLVPAEQAAAAARRLARVGFRVLKVKAGSPDPDEDIARVRAVRAAAQQARLLLDPNGAWSAEQTVRLLDAMADCRLDAVEQPIPPGTPDLLAWVGARTPLPLIADEDAATVADVHRLAGAVAGVNVKLAKCGGIAAATQVIDAARRYGMQVMLGCLVASSLGIVPAVHLTGLARWVDLDGHLLLSADPWTGIGGQDGVLRLTGEPGLGIRRAGAA